MTATLPASPELTDAELRSYRRVAAASGDMCVQVPQDDFARILDEIETHRSSPSSAWRDITEYKRDGTVVQRWHVMFNAPISVRWVNDITAFTHAGDNLHWVEASYAHAWPEESFTPHFRPLPEPPK